MGNLEADGGGLRAGGHASRALGAELAATTGVPEVGDRPSSAGIAAVDAASTSTRTRQSRRIGSYSDRLAAAADAYEREDGASASDVTVLL